MTPEPKQAAPPFHFDKIPAFAGEVTSYRVKVTLDDGRILELGRVTQIKPPGSDPYWVAYRDGLPPYYVCPDGPCQPGRRWPYPSRRSAADAVVLAWQHDKERTK